MNKFILSIFIVMSFFVITSVRAEETECKVLPEGNGGANYCAVEPKITDCPDRTCQAHSQEADLWFKSNRNQPANRMLDALQMGKAAPETTNDKDAAK